MNIVFRSLLCLILASCTTISAKEMKRNELTVGGIVENKEVYLEKFVYVAGYVTFGDDKSNIWNTKGDYIKVKNGGLPFDDPAWGMCISLYNTDKYRNFLKKYDNKNVVIYGKIVKFELEEGEINLSNCNSLGISIERISPS